MRKGRRIVAVLDSRGNKVDEVLSRRAGEMVKQGGWEPVVSSRSGQQNVLIAIREPASPGRNVLDKIISK